MKQVVEHKQELELNIKDLERVYFELLHSGQPTAAVDVLKAIEDIERAILSVKSY